MEIRVSVLLLPLAMLCIACGGPGSGPVAKSQLDPLVRDKDLSIQEQIDHIKADKMIPEPEKQRSLMVLEARQRNGEK